jgi:phosphoribosylformimino-5-aminoimidazole carboxamide ribotide isomerase
MAAETVYSADVTEVAGRWQQKGAGLIHVVDLNGAVDGEPKNLPHIESVMKTVRVKVQVGGGIRTIETIRRYLNAGVSRVVLGTAALMNRALLDLACQEFPQRIVLGLDARDGRIAVKGWTSVSDVKAIDLLKELSGCAIAAVVYTDIARDGMLNGPNVPALKEIVECSSFPVIASGGITRLEDLQAIRSLGPRIEGAIVGKALYDDKLDLRDAVAAFGKVY